MTATTPKGASSEYDVYVQEIRRREALAMRIARTSSAPIARTQVTRRVQPRNLAAEGSLDAADASPPVRRSLTDAYALDDQMAAYFYGDDAKVMSSLAPPVAPPVDSVPELTSSVAQLSIATPFEDAGTVRLDRDTMTSRTPTYKRELTPVRRQPVVVNPQMPSGARATVVQSWQKAVTAAAVTARNIPSASDEAAARKLLVGMEYDAQHYPHNADDGADAKLNADYAALERRFGASRDTRVRDLLQKIRRAIDARWVDDDDDDDE